MIRKRILSFITALGMALPTVLTAPVSSVSAAEPLTKEVYVNVAQFKPIKGGCWSDTYPLTNLVDGSRRTFVVPGSQHTDNEDGKPSSDGSFWFSVDLLHRYNIERIEFYDRYNQADEGGRRYFKILAANEPDFSDAVVLSEMGAPDDNIFPDNGPYVAELDGAKAYRYVKMQRTGGYYYGYSEFKVFAKQTVTEVSRNKTAIADEEAENGMFAAGLAVNGTNTDSRDAWVATSRTYHYLQVDLETPQHVGYVELEGRNGADNPYADRMCIDLYGADFAADASVYTSSAKVDGVEGIERLSTLNNNTQDYVTNPYPPYTAGDPDAMYKTSLNDSKAYRYIVYKKNTEQAAALGAFRAYVINPVITEANVKDGHVSVLFSDNMDAASLTADTVRVTDASTGEEVQISNLAVNGFRMTFDLPYNSDFNVTVMSTAQNTYGVSMAADKTVFTEGENIYEGLPSYTRLYNVAQNKPVTVSVDALQGDGDGSADVHHFVDDAQNTEGIVSYSYVDQWIKVDLLRKYKIDHVSIAPRFSSKDQVWLSGFEIQASNTADFSEYTVLDTCTEENALKAGTASATAENSSFNGSGGDAYRYVRIFARSRPLALSEIKVWAEQTMTEVSRGKPTVAGDSYSDTYNSSKAVDGHNEYENNAWVGSSSQYNYLRVDLEREYPIGAVEIESRANHNDGTARMMFSVFGNNTDDLAGKTEEELAALKGIKADELYTADKGYTKLTGMGNPGTTPDGYHPFPYIGDEAVTDPFYKASTNDTNSFRFITFKKVYQNGAAIGEMRIMVVNPVVNDIKADGNKVTVEFSDELSASSVNANRINVTDNDGNALEISNIVTDGYSVSFDVDNAPKTGICNVKISKAVRNTKGVTMAADYTGEAYFGGGISVTDIVFDKAELTASDTVKATAKLTNALAEDKTAVLITAVKSADGELMSVNIDRQAVLSGGAAELNAAVTLPADISGISVEAYVWENDTMIPLCEKTLF
ncbi:MAG: discoidin domain-containing protein [Clostridia bacterium]|nr:discoidin domain-containing protein [Clostridia bacterium]